MAEVDFDTELLFKLLVADEENVVVPRYCLHLRISLLHSAHGVFERAYRHRVYFLKQWVTELPVGVNKEQPLPVFSRCDEVSLHVADPLSIVDFLGSFVDHLFVPDSYRTLLSPRFASAKLRSMRFDSPSVRALDVGADGNSRNIRQVGVIFLDALRDMLGRLVVHEIRVNRFLEFHMFNDGVRAYPFVILINPGFVLGITCIVPPAFSCLCREFIRYRSLCYAEPIGDVLLRVSFSDKDVNLVSVAFRKPLFFCFFMRSF